MDPKTVNHIRIAERNLDLARALLDPALGGLRPTPWEWVAVIVFYAAVHMVNAYLWETRKYTPANHGDRRTAVRLSLPISRCSGNYRALQDAGYYARYDEMFAVSEQQAHTLLVVDFRRVEATVMQALGQPVPAW